MDNTVTIASVFWGPLKATRPFRELGTDGFSTTYRLNGVGPDDDPSVIVVKPAEELLDLGAGANSGISAPSRRIPQAVLPMQRINSDGIATFMGPDASARCIAEDLLQEFADDGVGLPEGMGGRGIWICEGKGPSKDEIRHWRAAQTEFARYVVDVADQAWLEGRRTTVKTYHRDACRWIGEDREWVHPEASAAQSIACPFCGKRTPAAVPNCQDCGETHNPILLDQVKTRLADVSARVKKAEQSAEQIRIARDLEEKERREKDFKNKPSNMPKHEKMAIIKERVHSKEPVAAE